MNKNRVTLTPSTVEFNGVAFDSVEVIHEQAMPSMKSRCPRRNCGIQMETAMLDSGVTEERCPESHYTARTVTGETRLAWAEATRRTR